MHLLEVKLNVVQRNKIDMKIKLYLLILLFSTSMISCKKKKNQPQKEEIAKIEAGKITNSVKCEHNYNVTYSVYLPSTKNKTKLFPVIFAFDPQGDGSLPVKLYSSLAEKFGFILIGSNNSKNGQNLDEVFTLFADLLTDIKNQLPVDTNNLYTLGFSGGARVAAMLPLTKFNIKAAICCSAGIDPSIISGNEPISYVFVTGTEDMNYLEVKQSFEEIQKKSIACNFILFDGKHKWAPEEAMNDAFLYLSLKTLRQKSIASDTLIVNNYVQITTKKAIAESDLTKKVYILKQLIANLKQFKSTENFENNIKQIESLSAYKVKYKSTLAIEAEEEKMQKKYAESFTSKDITWWQKQIENLNKQAKSTSKERSQLSIRLKNYISLVAFSTTSSALQSNNEINAENYVKIYKMVDPENPDMFYLTACLLSTEGEVDSAVEMLYKAIEKGFTDVSRLQKDPMLELVRMSESYQKLYLLITQ